MILRTRRNQGHVRSYTVTELNQQTPRVLEEINSSGVPALITKHGRFVALITPLAGVQVESILVSELMAQDEESSQESECLVSGDTLADELDFVLPDLPKRRED